MKVITTGNQRVNCEQCGSTLEYEWRDITEYNGSTCVFCPVCGRAIAVSDRINPNPYADLHSVTLKSTIPYEEYSISAPYDLFERNGVYASVTNAISDCATATTLGCSKNEADSSEVCTLTATI